MPSLPPELNIGQEQPPVEDAGRLSEWLTRTVININGALQAAKNLVPTSVFPTHPYNGLWHYFQPPYTSPVYYEGPWMYVDGEWRPIIGMTHQRGWEAGKTYWPQDVVTDGPWTMTCMVKTTDRPSPQPTGDAEQTLPDIPGFVTNSQLGVVHSGQRYIFNQGGWVSGLRIWVPDDAPNIAYRAVILNITDPENPISNIISTPSLIPGEWNVVAVGNNIVQIGSEFIVYIDALNSGGDTPFGPYDWTRGPISNNANPAFQSHNTNNQLNTLRIDKTDLDSTDRAAELLTIIAGSIITINATNEIGISQTFIVNANPVDAGSSINFNSVYLSGSTGTMPVGVPCDISAVIPVAQNTEYVQLDDYWIGGQPAWASVTGHLEFNGVEQPVDDHAFGVDISFTPGEISDDWEFTSYSAGIAATQALIDESIEHSIVARFNQLTAFDSTIQMPAGIDIPLQVKFGPAIGSAPDPIYLDANGTMFCTEDGFYIFDLVVSIGRSGVPLHAFMVLFLQINGINADVSGLVTIDNNDDIFPYTLSTTLILTAGDEVKLFAVRDAAGNDSGGLHPHIASTPGVSDVPSAWVRVTHQDLIPT